MNDKPLFGAGSSAPKHTKNRGAFLRPSPASDGRLNSAALDSQPKTNVAPVLGTKANRKTQPDILPAAAAVAAPVAAPVQNPVAGVKPAPNPVAEQPLAPTPQTAVGETTANTAVPGQGVVPKAYPVIKQEGSMEDRQGTRKRALKGALIIMPGQMMSSYACKIRNESSSGVMLVLSDALMVPPEFYLIRDADPGHKIPCRVAWREKNSLGAKFVSALSPP